MLIIGIAGGSGSGKTTVVRKIIECLPEDSVTVISQDSYYKDKGYLSDEEKKKINFDHPNSIEFNLLIKHVNDLKNGKSIERPVYSYVTCARLEETVTVKPSKVIIVEGILVFTHPELLKLMGVKVFVDADSDNRLMRIINRDIQERGRNFKEVLDHYEEFVRPMYLQFIEPTKRYADLVVPQGGENKVAIDILVARIKEILNN
ncbi:MAG: uridine kinase [Bacteroidales bacterium]|mgnify:CR=1 FL=1|nr:uridine kinase [Bacteroidales bacterium]MCF8327085.1 uridine kinase [Bacteroidales bacterium]